MRKHEQDQSDLDALKAQLRDMGIRFSRDAGYAALEKLYRDEIDRRWHVQAASGNLIRRKRKKTED